ncbi:hypothetical protein DFH09DRAFT_1302756 [Mycena vulgaris]|nr:hypothetical protein DFH09DRAFT_1302756 [Mycena vulgaris]
MLTHSHPALPPSSSRVASWRGDRHDDAGEDADRAATTRCLQFLTLFNLLFWNLLPAAGTSRARVGWLVVRRRTFWVWFAGGGGAVQPRRTIRSLQDTRSPETTYRRPASGLIPHDLALFRAL